MNDELLELLGNYFVSERWRSKGWTFEEFVNEFKLGRISIQ